MFYVREGMNCSPSSLTCQFTREVMARKSIALNIGGGLHPCSLSSLFGQCGGQRESISIAESRRTLQ